MRPIATALAAVALAAGTAGCGSLTTAATEVGGVRMTDERPVREGGTLTVALNVRPRQARSDARPDPRRPHRFRRDVREALRHRRAGKVVPQLAAALPRTSHDGRTVTFPIRPGPEVQRRHPAGRGGRRPVPAAAPHLAGSARATELAPLTGAVATGELTVRLTLKQPYVPLTGVLADRAGMVMSPPR